MCFHVIIIIGIVNQSTGKSFLISTGADSWCFWQCARALGNTPDSHERCIKTPLCSDVITELVPPYSRMSSDQLLQRVVHGKTQYPNESFNALLWSMLLLNWCRFTAGCHLTSFCSEWFMERPRTKMNPSMLCCGWWSRRCALLARGEWIPLRQQQWAGTIAVDFTWQR